MCDRRIREVWRCNRVVGILSSIGSWVRLETFYLLEYSEDGPTDRSYVKLEEVQEALAPVRTFLTTKTSGLRENIWLQNCELNLTRPNLVKSKGSFSDS